MNQYTQMTKAQIDLEDEQWAGFLDGEFGGYLAQSGTAPHHTAPLGAACL